MTIVANIDNPEKTCKPPADLTSLVTTHPCQGVLSPYERRVLYFKFSPRYEQSQTGWKNGAKPPPRQDFALFMRIEAVGAVNSDGKQGKSRIEQCKC